MDEFDYVYWVAHVAQDKLLGAAASACSKAASSRGGQGGAGEAPAPAKASGSWGDSVVSVWDLFGRADLPKVVGFVERYRRELGVEEGLDATLAVVGVKLFLHDGWLGRLLEEEGVTPMRVEVAMG